MKYSSTLRKMFSGITLDAVDLLLLESFQLKYLPDRVPKKEFATLIRKYPFVKAFLVAKDPCIEEFILSVLDENKEIEDEELIKEHCDELLWEIADLILYNKFPEIYDSHSKFRWEVEEIILKESLHGKTVADVGAGSGALAFLLARHAQTVFAIEPIGSFRRYMREKIEKEGRRNVYPMDGFLDHIPLPDNSLDILFTSNAIGWNLKKELHEIERVVKPEGQAIHLVRVMGDKYEETFHEILISPEWNYECIKGLDEKGLKIKYSKYIH
jgi:hypothetical protein